MKKSRLDSESDCLWLFFPVKTSLFRAMTAWLFILLSAFQLQAKESLPEKEKISVVKEIAPIKEILKEIEQQTDFTFFYNHQEIDVHRRISVNLREVTLAVAIEEIFRDTPVRHRISGRQILLYKIDSEKRSRRAGNNDPARISDAVYAFQVSGTIRNESGESMPGVNVVEKGTTNGTVSDADGRYALSVSAEDATVVFSFIGYTTIEVAVNGRTFIDVTLAEDIQRLDEVVVVGFGTAKKATLTGSVSTVSGNDIKISPATNFTNTLAGRLPGLVTVNTSGEPGDDNPTIRIRGSNTLGDNSPLVVIDGITGRDMTGLDPAEIESVSVLKDASAAIFGARAANGVILITTKRGKIGRPEVNVNYNYGLSMPTVIPEMADAATYATMLNEINYYAGLAPVYTAEEIQKYRDGSDPWLYPNTDWFAAVFKPSTPQSKGDISISGGSESMKYFVSTGFRSQDAIYRNSSAKYSQVNFRTNIDGKINEHISLSLDISGRQEQRNFADNPFSYLINRSKPMFIAYYPGNKPAAGYQAGQSPVILASDLLGYDRRKTYYFLSNAKLLVTVPWVKGLSFTSNISFDKEIYNGKFWRQPYTLYSWDRMTFDSNGDPVVVGALDGPYATPELRQNFSDGQNVTLNALVNYDITLANKHNIRVLAAAERITGEAMDLMAFRRGFVSTAVDQMFAGGDPDKNNGGSASQHARLDYFGRINYEYLQKYLVEFVWRYDGSYIFPEEGRFGFFPGVSAGWRISEEDFWKNSLPFINSFKIRGSWGQTGNDRIPEYQYLSSYGFGTQPLILNGNLEVKTLNELRVANPNVTWEVANQSNVGFDAQILNGKIDISAEYFYNHRTNILTYRNASVPASTGLILPRENIGEVVNRGFEVQLGYHSNFGQFNFGITANGALAKNKIKFWDESPGVPEYQRSTGKPMNAGLYYIALGVFKDQEAVDSYPHWPNARPGDIIFKDVNGDGEINGLDLVRHTKTDLPTFTGGVSINLSYKSFYSSILFQGAAGAVRSYTLESGFQGNFLADDANGRWTEENHTSAKPRTWNTGGEYWTSGLGGGTWGINNTYWLKNNDYLRLKNLQVGYNIPRALCSKVNVSNISLYFSGLNLLTFTPLKSFDPETVGNVYPLSKVYNFGINVSL